jgi:hypothetical protein
MSGDERLRTAEVIDELAARWPADQSPPWENATLEAYLRALAAWIRDSDGYYANQDLPMPQPWQVIRDALQAATTYE